MNYTIRDVAEGVCIRFSMTMDQIRGVNATRHYARPRQIVMFLAREMTGQSLPQIGRYLCRDHTTIMYGQRLVSRLVAADPNTAAAVESCRAIIRHRGSWKMDAVQMLADRPLVEVRAA